MNADISAKAEPGSTERHGPAALRAAGLVPLTTTDFPGRLAAVVFCQGCPWACGYCHNPHLIPAAGPETLDWPRLHAFLNRRRGLLDGVVFSGGEPTAQRALPAAVKATRALGFEVGLHSAGPYPGRLARLLPDLDWVGLDIKAGFADYPAVTGVPGSGERARRSLEAVLASGVDYEVRTTVHPLLFDRRRIRRLATDLAARGVRDYVLQISRPEGCADPTYRAGGANELLDAALRERLASLFERFQVREA